MENLMAQTCESCGARCCRYFCFEIDTPGSYEEFENARWYLMHEGVTVHIDLEGDWYIAIANRCLNLDEGNRCLQYAERPLICRKYDIDGCDFTKGNYEYIALFTKPDHIEQYARAKLGPARFDKIKAAARARVEKHRAAALAKKSDKGAMGDKTRRKSTPIYLARTRRTRRRLNRQPLSRLFA
jgi:Fe-S-cluster containining protein